MNWFIDWWQHLPAQMNPTIFMIGNFPIRWYGTMYIVAFTIVYLMTNWRLKHDQLNYSKEFVSNVITWAILGLLLGGRFGYVLFYNFQSFLSDPLSLISPFARIRGELKFTGIAGMSYHGGVIGIAVAWLIFARKNKISVFKIADLIIPAIPLGFMFGRLGNFINGELYGRVTEAAIGMHFPSATAGILRHPSQLYEAFFEGLVLFAIVWPLRNKKLFVGFISGLYIFGYGFFRFFIEFYREPDEHLGFVLGSLSMGQVLCITMMIGAGVLWYIAKIVERRSD